MLKNINMSFPNLFGCSCFLCRSFCIQHTIPRCHLHLPSGIDIVQNHSMLHSSKVILNRSPQLHLPFSCSLTSICKRLQQMCFPTNGSVLQLHQTPGKIFLKKTVRLTKGHEVRHYNLGFAEREVIVLIPGSHPKLTEGWRRLRCLMTG